MDKVLNRSALIVVPKQPYYDWGNALYKGEEIDKCDECSCYLLDDNWDIDEIETYLKKHFDAIFMPFLDHMCPYEEAWPENRSWIMFNHWFEWHYSSVVWDLLPDKRIRRTTW